MTMRRLGAVCAGGAMIVACSVAWVATAGAAETYRLPTTVRALVTDADAFMRFQRQVSERVETELQSSPAPTAERRAALLALRAHLSLADGNMARALATAKLIRATQASPLERAFSGITTEAYAAAYHATKSVGALRTDSPAFAAAFRESFAQALAGLPVTPEAATLLSQQRERIRALSREELLAAADRLGAKLDGARRADFADADQVIRIGHRLKNLVPLRESMLAEFDVALAARTKARD